MARVHTVRPTDLMALAGYDGRVYPNEAVTRDRTGTQASPHLLEAALEQWFSFATGRHTWISVKGSTLRGLVSARRRGTKAAWELDCLIDAAEDDPGVLASLLDQVTRDAGRAGAEKVFLRVPSGSHVAEEARRCGFKPYLTERLLATEGALGDRQRGSSGVRRTTRADTYGMFRLYNRWTPESVRRIEAATLREWVAARERLSAPRDTRQWVLEQSGRIVGWLRTAVEGEVGRFDIMADPSSPDLLEPLIETAHARLREQSTLVALVPEFAEPLASRLEACGFTEQAEFIVLSRRTTRPVRVARRARRAESAQVQTFPA